MRDGKILRMSVSCGPRERPRSVSEVQHQASAVRAFKTIENQSGSRKAGTDQKMEC